MTIITFEHNGFDHSVQLSKNFKRICSMVNFHLFTNASFLQWGDLVDSPDDDYSYREFNLDKALRRLDKEVYDAADDLFERMREVDPEFDHTHDFDHFDPIDYLYAKIVRHSNLHPEAYPYL